MDIICEIQYSVALRRTSNHRGSNFRRMRARAVIVIKTRRIIIGGKLKIVVGDNVVAIVQELYPAHDVQKRLFIC